MVHTSRSKLKPAQDQLRTPATATTALLNRRSLPVWRRPLPDEVAWSDLVADYDRIRGRSKSCPDFALR